MGEDRGDELGMAKIMISIRFTVRCMGRIGLWLELEFGLMLG